MTTIPEILTLAFILISASVLSFCSVWAIEDFCDWMKTRRKKTTLFGKKHWSPAFWTRSVVGRFAVKRGKDFRRFIVNFIMPIFKGLQLGVQSIEAIRAVYRESEMWWSSAKKYRPGTHLTQLWCKACANQSLGVWLDRLPDSESGEPLTNRPHRSVCLKCYNEMPKEKRALYSVAWTEYNNPYEGEEEMEYEYAPPILRSNPRSRTEVELDYNYSPPVPDPSELMAPEIFERLEAFSGAHNSHPVFVTGIIGEEDGR